MVEARSVKMCIRDRFLAALYLVAGIPLKMIAKSLKPIVPIIALTTVLNVFMICLLYTSRCV